MTHKLPISVFIIALNEGDRIGRTIASVRDWVNEVIVVDSHSLDDTVEVSEKAGATVYQNNWEGYGPQKRYGEEQCKNDWLFNLDADEVVSEKLALEIQTLFAGKPELFSGYSMDVCHMLPGEEKLPRRTQVNHVLRLYNKWYARFSESPVHDSVILREGNVHKLRGPVYHHSYRSYEHAIAKTNLYTTALARDMIKRGKQVPKARLLFEFPLAFFKGYFFRGYVFRGTRGFNYAMMYAFMRFARLAKHYEMTHGEKSKDN